MGIASMSRRAALRHEGHQWMRGFAGTIGCRRGSAARVLVGQVGALFDPEGTGHSAVSLLDFHTRLPKMIQPL